MENSELILVLVHQSVLVDCDVAEILLLLVLNINQSINYVLVDLLQICHVPQSAPKETKFSKLLHSQTLFPCVSLEKKVRFNFISVSMTKLDAEFFTRFRFICGSSLLGFTAVCVKYTQWHYKLYNLLYFCDFCCCFFKHMNYFYIRSCMIMECDGLFMQFL